MNSCNDIHFLYHNSLKVEEPIKASGNLVPYTDQSRKECHLIGSDPEDILMPYKLENLAKRGHDIPLCVCQNNRLRRRLLLRFQNIVF